MSKGIKYRIAIKKKCTNEQYVKNNPVKDESRFLAIWREGWVEGEGKVIWAYKNVSLFLSNCVLDST